MIAGRGGHVAGAPLSVLGLDTRPGPSGLLGHPLGICRSLYVTGFRMTTAFSRIIAGELNGRFVLQDPVPRREAARAAGPGL